MQRLFPIDPCEKWENGAGDATRTRDIFLGKEVLYQLSYTRVVFVECNESSGAAKSFLAMFEAPSHFNGFSAVIYSIQNPLAAKPLYLASSLFIPSKCTNASL